MSITEKAASPQPASVNSAIDKGFFVKMLNQDEILESLVRFSFYCNFADENINGIVENIPSVTMS